MLKHLLNFSFSPVVSFAIMAVKKAINKEPSAAKKAVARDSVKREASQQKAEQKRLNKLIQKRAAARELAEESNVIVINYKAKLAAAWQSKPHQFMFKQAWAAVREGRSASVPRNMKYN